MYGDTVTIDIHFGDAIDSVDGVYGLGFSLFYDQGVVDTSFMQFDVSNSWLGGTNDAIWMIKHIPDEGRGDVGFTRIDHEEVWIGVTPASTCFFSCCDDLG